MRTFRRYAAIGAATAVLGIAGCGQNADTPSAPSAVDQQKLAQYKTCMQSAGIEVPDPDPNGGKNAVVTLSTSDPKNLAALSACARYAPPVDAKDAPSDAEQARALKLAECLRKQGIKAKDPAANTSIVSIEDGAVYSQQQLTTAYTICNQQVPALSSTGGGK